MTNAAPPVPSDRRQLATLDQLASIPEEEIWLAKQKSAQSTWLTMSAATMFLLVALAWPLIEKPIIVFLRG